MVHVTTKIDRADPAVVKDLAAFCKQLEAKGIKFDVPYREVPAISLKIAYITDPTGVYIELTEGYDKY